MTRRTADPTNGRPLVVCIGGPLDRRWYYLDDWEHQRRAAGRMNYPLDHPSAVSLTYTATDMSEPHPEHPTSGKRWTYADPTSHPNPRGGR